ncbi:MAG: ABC transporter ATP-binding protein [Egibacteraceae bacterium]
MTVTGVTVEIDGTTIVSGAELVVEPGEFVGLLGHNGSGKSTLLRTIYRALRPVLGTVCVGKNDVWRLSARESARRTAVVAQESTGEFDFTVSEVVETGRNPHKGPLDRHTEADEKQRVLVARALAQESRVPVLDEPPTTSTSASNSSCSTSSEASR